MDPTVAVVAFPTSIPGLYDYRIPSGLCGSVVEGSPVLVQVRTRTLWGMVVARKEHSAFSTLKEILEVKTGLQLRSFTSLIRLYEWIAGYYQCELGKVFKPFVRKRLMETPVKEIDWYTVTGAPASKLTSRQTAALALLDTLGEGGSRERLMTEFGLSAHMISALCTAKVLASTPRIILREAVELGADPSAGEVVLSGEQRDVVAAILASFAAPGKPFLLHGITGSGKTHVYIELVKHALAQGRGALMLVPEISLTPQTIQRFRAAIQAPMAVIHSNMSEGERRDSLESLISGRVRVVIGVRSAVLAPVDNLGVIIVDEEHDGSYKQADPEPRYHARDVAVMRGRMQGALVVLGSATPSLESYHNAGSGKFTLLHLDTRFGDATLPAVRVVDMNAEHAQDNWTVLSRPLHEGIAAALEAGRQVILLLNRRGYSTFLICKDCGKTHRCPACSVNLVYHRSELVLRCHQCGHSTSAPSVCPQCKGDHLQYKGTGIQKAEEFLREAFPSARIMRMDQDTTRRKGAHVSIIEAFGSNQADILIGTQMVSKGLDFPGVALVGVLQADVGLHIPDFRASEKTFQLLTQVAGRAGRNDNLGLVIVQTYFPSEHAVTCAAAHDYLTFFTREIQNREELGYPPFCRLARIVVSGKKQDVVRDLAVAVGRLLIKTAGDALRLLGPVPAVLERIKEDYRFSILIKSETAGALKTALQVVGKKYTRGGPGGCRITIDVDPSNML